jgi:hypothetical protein
MCLCVLMLEEVTLRDRCTEFALKSVSERERWKHADDCLEVSLCEREGGTVCFETRTEAC